jgi:DNA polymerase-3 subunit gamma/tau
MSYHVLARRWRPQTFTEMVGQEHVLKALTNALSHDRLHHAYLFTGTRGVGKTTVARIFAKSLNCEEGVGPNPCGQCSACVEIAEGRFVDLIEVDAASRTKVEDTRELLENVQYSPSRGRFKVYIIDEVHMLSTSSFNALLKTLEEPPEHVKFLLATTDPQKLPVTVLSRCLQFNLKNMSPERIVNHLKFVLGQEKVPFEEPALWLLAKAADGSMRDALSLTDQSIAFGNESVMELDVQNMLGTVDRAYVAHILEALAKQNAVMVLDEVARAADHAPDYSGILDELIAMLHRVAVGQMVPGAIDNSQGDQEYIIGMCQVIQPHDVHLFYQIALASRKDMAAAADQRAALEMTLLRMLAFQIKRPGQTLDVPSTPLPNAQSIPDQQTVSNEQPVSHEQPAAHIQPEATAQVSPSQVVPPEAHASEPFSTGNGQVLNAAGEQTEKKPQQNSVESVGSTEPNTYDEQSAEPLQRNEASTVELEPVSNVEVIQEEKVQADSGNDVVHVKEVQVKDERVLDEQPGHDQPVDEHSDWLVLERALELDRFTANLAANMVPVERGSDAWHFILTKDMETFLNKERVATLSEALSVAIGKSVTVTVEPGTLTAESPAEYRIRKKAERLQLAISTFHDDPHVVFWKSNFGGQVLEDTVVPID